MWPCQDFAIIEQTGPTDFIATVSAVGKDAGASLPKGTKSSLQNQIADPHEIKVSYSKNRDEKEIRARARRRNSEFQAEKIKRGVIWSKQNHLGQERIKY